MSTKQIMDMLLKAYEDGRITIAEEVEQQYYATLYRISVSPQD